MDTNAAAPSPVRRTYFSTESLPPERRRDAWVELVRPFMPVVTMENVAAEGIRCQQINHLFGPITIGRSCFDGADVTTERSKATVAASGLDHWLIQLYEHGSLTTQSEETQARLAPGDICIYDLSRPVRNAFRTARSITLVMRRDLLEHLFAPPKPRRRILRANEPGTRLLGDYLHSLADLAPSLGEHDVAMVTSTTVAMFEGCLPVDECVSGATAATSLPLRERIARWIDRHLADPKLDPDTVQRQFRLSRTTLYRLFAEHGGAASYIRNLRLDAAFRDISRAGRDSRSITEILYRWGFTGERQFQRAFRARFHVTPTQARHSAAAVPGSDGDRLAELAGRLEAIQAAES